MSIIRRHVPIFLTACLLAGCGSGGRAQSTEPVSYQTYAQWGEEQLIKYFWNEEGSFLNNQYPYVDANEWDLNYWWKAHGVDAMADALERTGDEAYARRGEQIAEGIILRNGSLYNEFYDDMEWLALACLRLYDHTKDERMKEITLKLWEEIKMAWWDDEIGGMAWKTDAGRVNRNTCSNMPAAILAARLYQRFDDKQDLQWAEKIFEFQKKYLVEPESGKVYDGLVVQKDGSLDINKDWIFTYGQGTYIGAATELYRITGDTAYLSEAEKTAAFAITHLNNDAGVLQSEGGGDGGLFKGILVRYLAGLYEVNRDESIKTFIYHNADTLVSTGYSQSNGVFAEEWDKPLAEQSDITTQLSGVFLLEAAAKIERVK